jgi:hypothetical protein
VLTFPKNAVLPPDTPNGFGWLSFWPTGQPVVSADEPAVRYCVMGDLTDPQAPGNVWRSAASWPPPSQPLRLYLNTEGELDPQPPATAATKEYDYDPTKPVPTVGGQEIFLPLVGAQDQRKVEGRPDVLVFSTPPHTAPLEVTGRISVHLNATTSARDTDFTAKLTDVYSDGRSILLSDGIVRARFRHSLETEDLITPGQTYAYDIDLWSTSLIFNKGHQIRVAISRSNAPRFEPNANTGGALPPDPKEKLVVAHQTIFLGGAGASYIVLPQVVGTATQEAGNRRAAAGRILLLLVAIVQRDGALMPAAARHSRRQEAFVYTGAGGGRACAYRGSTPIHPSLAGCSMRSSGYRARHSSIRCGAGGSVS